jgi:hypothetical protein
LEHERKLHEEKLSAYQLSLKNQKAGFEADKERLAKEHA